MTITVNFTVDVAIANPNSTISATQTVTDIGVQVTAFASAGSGIQVTWVYGDGSPGDKYSMAPLLVNGINQVVYMLYYYVLYYIDL